MNLAAIKLRCDDGGLSIYRLRCIWIDRHNTRVDVLEAAPKAVTESCGGCDSEGESARRIEQQLLAPIAGNNRVGTRNGSGRNIDADIRPSLGLLSGAERVALLDRDQVLLQRDDRDLRA